MMVVGDWLQSAGPLGTSLAFLGSAGMILRLSLSGATTHRTVETHSLADNFSSTAQNIAFAANDIFASAECLAANGFSPLAIPQDYYEDLAARFDLADELLNRMKAANILYDKNENGAFFQYYSQLYGDGLFFEIVERGGG